MEAKQTIAESVRRSRKSLGMTQEHLADLAGTKKSNISRLESGRYNPSIEFLNKIATSLGKELTVELK